MDCSHQAPLSIGFSRQEYWSGLRFPSPQYILCRKYFDVIYVILYLIIFITSVTQLCLTLQPHGLQQTRLPCPQPTPKACSNSCPSSQWCHPTLSLSVISSSVIPVSCLQSFLSSGTFPMSQFFISGGQSIGASSSVLPKNIKDWFPLRLIALLSLQSKGLSRVFSNTTVQDHQFFGAQLSLWSNSHIHTWLWETW